MNALSAFANQQVWHIAGWTMLHYLWLGAFVGIFAIVCRMLLRRAAANLRYATALGCLFLLATLPVGIATWVATNLPPLTEINRGEFHEPIATIELNVLAVPAHGEVIDLRDQPEPLAIAEHEAETHVDPANPPKPEPSWNSSLKWSAVSFGTLQACVPYLPWLWIVGTPLTFALLAAGVVGTKRLRSASRATDDPRIAELLARLRESLRIGKRITVAICDRIASPVLVGIVRPIILLPPAALTGWSPDEIEMVLLHELAHVRRWDNLVNLIQRLIESLLFFHPAVWLVSNWVRRERESCCDAFVVRRTERPHAYAELLVNIASQLSEPGRPRPRSFLRGRGTLASAMSAGPLRTRIRRILQLEDDPMLISGKSLALMLATLFTAATLAVLYVPRIGQAEESTTEVTEGKADDDKQKNKTPSTDESTTNSEAELKKESAQEPQVVATLPPTALAPPNYTPPNEFIAAYKAAREKNHYVELLHREDDLALIEVPQPSESNWPGILGESPRKDRVIAEKAYARLGLKLAPLTSAETRYREFTNQPLGVMIAGGNVPKGLPLPSLLTTIGDHNISSMNSLLQWLESNQGKGTTSVKCYAVADSNEYLFDSVYRPAPQPPASTVDGKEIPTGSRKPMTPEAMVEMMRVQNAVATTLPPAASDRILIAYQIPDDLPYNLNYLAETRHLQAMWDQRNRFVLQGSREEHAALKSILKETPKWRDPAAAQARIKQPLVMSEVDGEPILEWRGAGLTFKRETRPEYLSLNRPGGVEITKVAPGSPADWQSIGPGDSLTNIEEFRIGSLEELKSVMESLLEGFSDTSKTLKLNFARKQSPGAQPISHIGYRSASLPLRPDELAIQQGERNRRIRESDERMELESGKRQELKEAEAQQATPIPGTESPPDATPGDENANTQPASPETNPSNLRYDGKSFDEWRNAWQTELSTKKRLEAVRALAAFGPRGYGREAAESILEVAGEYKDWTRSDGSFEAQLREAVVDGLANHVPASAWLTPLRQRFDTDPKKWQWLAIRTLQGLKPADEDEKNEAQSFLLELTQSDVDAISSYAVSALVKLDPALENEQTKKLVLERLNSDDLDVVRAIMGTLVTTPQFPPELIDLLLHGDSKRQLRLRRSFDRDNEWTASLALADTMTALLKDKTKAADHLAAIRTLAAMGRVADKAKSDPVDVLRSIAMEGNAEHQIAAAFALEQITNGQMGAAPMLAGKVRTADGKVLDEFALQTPLARERKAVFGEPRQ